MNKLLLFAMCISAAAVAAPQEATSAGKAETKASAKPEAKTAPEKPLTAIPSDAVQFEPGAFRWTDTKGKKWILFQTPFGIARKEDTGEPLRKKQEEPQIMQAVKITEDGDSLKFEREGPFGTYKWSKKKSELSDEEKLAWERQKAEKNTTAKQDR
jgi:hypothetical protein